MIFSDEERDRQAEERRFRSEAILRDAKVLSYSCLSEIETADMIKPRAPIEIARRAVCSLLVAARGSGLDVRTVRMLANSYGVSDNFTPEEKAFLDAKRPTPKTKIIFSWRSEAAWILLWALGFVDELGLPLDQISPSHAVNIVEDNQIEGLISNATPRTMDEILDQADLIYRCHWAVRHFKRTGKREEVVLNSSVTFERHYALNWLIRYGDQDWDDVATDT